MIIRFRNLLSTSRFARNTALMTLAGIGSHAVFLAASPILTRLFSPEAFALLGLFTTIQALLLTWVTGRVEWSVPNAHDKREGHAMILGALAILCLSCFGLLIAGIFVPETLFGYAKETPVPRLILLILPLSVFMAGAQAVLQSWYVAMGSLKMVSLSRIALSMVYSIAAIAIGLVVASGETLVACFAISHFAAALVLMQGAGQLRQQAKGLTRSFVSRVLREFRPEIFASLASSIVHGISFYLMFLLIWWYFDATIVGWFALVFRIANAPVGLLTTSLSKGFWAEAADLAKRDVPLLRKLYLRVSLVLTGAAVAFALLTLSAPWYFGFVFGNEWAGAGAMLAALTPMLVAMIVFSSTNHFIVYRRQHWQLYCDLTTIILILLAFWGMTSIGAEAAATLWVASFAFLISYLLRFALHLRANTLFRQAQSC